jgi:hypothetical protein
MCFIEKKEMSKRKIKQSYSSPLWISLALEQHQPRQRLTRIYRRVGRDAYIWIWLSFCEICKDIFVCAYISLITKLRRAFLPIARLIKSFKIKLMLKRGFEHLILQKHFHNHFTKRLYFGLNELLMLQTCVWGLQPQTQTCFIKK